MVHGAKAVVAYSVRTGRRRLRARVVHANGDGTVPYDLAVLEVEVPSDADALPMADRLPEAGDRVFGVGFQTADALTPTVAPGTVMAVRSGLVVTNLSLQSGMSGGPVLDSSGRVLGVMTSHLQDTASGAHYPNVNFVIPLCRELGAALRDYGRTRRLKDLKRSLRTSDAEVREVWSRLVPSEAKPAAKL